MSDVVLPEMFLCQRTAMRLTTKGCARLWMSANDHDREAKNGHNRRQQSYQPAPWQGKFVCWSCPLGAKNAGIDFEVHALADMMRTRCSATGAIVSRLVVGQVGAFDVSVYNRRLEAARKRNARGGRPRICDELHIETLAVIDGDVVAVKTFGPVLSPFEALLNAARTASGGMVAIGRPGVKLVPEQTAEAVEKIAA